MKRNILILFLVLSSSLSGQSAKEKLIDKSCDCFKKTTDSIINYEIILDTCFQQLIQDDLDNIILEEYDLESNLSDYEQGQLLSFNLMIQMIQECDSFLKFFDEMRNIPIKRVKEQVINSGVRIENISSDGISDLDSIWKIGQKHLALDKLELAKKDFQRCLELNPNYIQAEFFLAWVYEKEGDFKKSIELNEKVYKVTKNDNFRIILEIVKQKEKKYNTQQHL
jgi:tetratricopeptide (TPR) repeat protein